MQILAPLAFLLAAATHTPNQAPPPVLALKTLSACTAVTKSEIEAALGRPVSGGVEHKGDGQSTCDYEGGDGQITIALIHSNDKLNADVEIADLKKLLPKGVVRDAVGLGARAFFVDIPNAGSQLHVLRGEHDYLMVSVLGFGGPGQISDTVMRIASKALERL